MEESHTAADDDPIISGVGPTTTRQSELVAVLERMTNAHQVFYEVAQVFKLPLAVRDLVAFFVEYTNLCTDALEAGLNFTELAAHTGPGRVLPMKWFRIQYLGEKFGKLFKPWLNTDERIGAFMHAARLTRVRPPESELELERAMLITEAYLLRTFGPGTIVTLELDGSVKIAPRRDPERAGISLWHAFRTRAGA